MIANELRELEEIATRIEKDLQRLYTLIGIVKNNRTIHNLIFSKYIKLHEKKED